MAERNIGERLLGAVRDIVTAPVRSYRAEKLRQQQADTLIARDDLTLGNVGKIADLMKETRNSHTVLRLSTKLRDVVFTETAKMRASRPHRG